ncbi:MAG: hypothetical protein ACOC44_10110 [Promethearchaeia archaeon]
MDCYDRILTTYKQRANIGSEYFNIWKSKALIKLMSNLRENKSETLKIKNCLIVLINLLYNVNSPDYCTEIGKDKNQLTKEEKKNLEKLLKQEFN